MRAELIAAVMLLSAAAHAEEDKLAKPWNELAAECQAWDLTSTKSFAKGAVAWDRSEHAAQENVSHFSKSVCPSYLGAANASTSVGETARGITLESFTQELLRVYSNLTDVKTKAEKQKAYLDENIDRLTKFFNGGGWNIKDHPCGARFLERRTYVVSELALLQKRVDAISTECPKASQVLSASQASTHKAGAAKGAGSGAVAAPAGSARTKGSDITGVKEEGEKAQ